MTATQQALLEQHVANIYSQSDWEQCLKSKKKLRVKLGCDPTRPDLHIGHMLVLDKLRRFQEFGHQVVFIIGDFTSMIGDPTDKNVTRPMLTRAEVMANAETYKNQIGKILDLNSIEFHYNSHWFQKLDALSFIQLTAKQTVARMLERDDFSKRFKQQQAIHIHEFIYPLLQGYDSVHLNIDIEIGGTDQTFNMLVGRHLQKEYDQKPQVVMTLPLLEGTDGVKKMSKSYHNTINFNDTAQDMFGKVMSISDALMWRYFNQLTDLSASKIAQLKDTVATGSNPRDIKMDLAKHIIQRFHTKQAADDAQNAFIARFSQKQIPDNLPLQQIQAPTQEGMLLSQLLKQAALASSTSEALRLIKQKAVRIDEKVIETNQLIIPETPCLIQVGKRRIARIILKSR